MFEIRVAIVLLGLFHNVFSFKLARSIQLSHNTFASGLLQLGSIDEDWPGARPEQAFTDTIKRAIAIKRKPGIKDVDIVSKSPTCTFLEDDGDSELGFQSEHFRSGFVSILGNPNVGKSTLMNGLLGESLCIVSPKPQTTRHRILGILTVPPKNEASTEYDERGQIQGAISYPIPSDVPYEEHGYQLIFADTPGMLSPAYKLQEVMQDTVRGAANDADVILLVTDVYGEPLVDANIMTKLSLTNRPIVVAINKIDIAAKEFPADPAPNESAESSGEPNDISSSRSGGSFASMDSAYYKAPVPKSRNDRRSSKPSAAMSLQELRRLWKERLPRAEIVEISAMQGRNTTQLLHTILKHIPLGPLYYPKDTLTTRNERFFTAEIIRECILKLYKDEIPYSCEVTIESFKDRSAGLSAIEADIIVSRQSQKAIVIGKGGAQLKELGILARGRLEKFLDRKVYLALRVRVDEEWRSNGNSLKQYGYIEQE